MFRNADAICSRLSIGQVRPRIRIRLEGKRESGVGFAGSALPTHRSVSQSHKASNLRSVNQYLSTDPAMRHYTLETRHGASENQLQPTQMCVKPTKVILQWLYTRWRKALFMFTCPIMLLYQEMSPFLIRVIWYFHHYCDKWIYCLKTNHLSLHSLLNINMYFDWIDAGCEENVLFTLLGRKKNTLLLSSWFCLPRDLFSAVLLRFDWISNQPFSFRHVYMPRLSHWKEMCSLLFKQHVCKMSP